MPRCLIWAVWMSALVFQALDERHGLVFEDEHEAVRAREEEAVHDEGGDADEEAERGVASAWRDGTNTRPKPVGSALRSRLVCW